jgi:protein ImuA
MKPSGREQVLESLREHAAQLECAASGSRVNRTALAFGLVPLDRRLPGGGLLLGCLHEVALGGCRGWNGRRGASAAGMLNGAAFGESWTAEYSSLAAGTAR